MDVHVLSAYPAGRVDPNNFQATWVRESALLDPHGVHHLTDDPAKADIILFVENHPGHDPLFLRVARHPIWRKYHRKCFLYHDSDYAYPFFPGLYPSLLRAHQRPSRCAGAAYVGRIEQNTAVQFEPPAADAPLLFSFMGTVNCVTRKHICALQHGRAVIRDTTGKNLWTLPEKERDRYTQEYGEVLRTSKFVLCPRGFGPSTYRLFETLEAGRVPVILANHWVPPAGPKWEEFSIRIPEAEVQSMPKLLESREGDAQRMGLAARAAWEKWFSKPVMFHHMVNACHAIQQQRQQTRGWDELSYSTRLLKTRPRFILRFIKKTVINLNH